MSVFLAPELLLQVKTYSFAIDLWSLGITIFELLFGYSPFYPPSACLNEKLYIPPEASETSLHDFLNVLLNRDPTLRTTALELLHHPWFQCAYNDR